MNLEQLRKQIISEIPITYNPYVHALIPSTIGIFFIVTALMSLSNVTSLSLLTIPITIFLLFGFEWAVHKYVLHKKQFGLKELYEKHELMHHIIYTNTDMSMKDKKELYLILMPSYAIVLIFILLLPLIFLLTSLLSANVALLTLATALAFFLTYEWLHFCYHLPADTWLARRKTIQSLRRLHTVHHNPIHMKKWNFNVTFPIFDRILRTYRKD